MWISDVDPGTCNARLSRSGGGKAGKEGGDGFRELAAVDAVGVGVMELGFDGGGGCRGGLSGCGYGDGKEAEVVGRPVC